MDLLLFPHRKKKIIKILFWIFWHSLFVEKKGWIFVSDPEGFKNPSKIEINVQKVEAESWESYAAIFLILQLKILKVFELTIF